MPVRVLIVFGTRPEAIKMAPLALVLAADARFDAKVCVTGQHREMLDQVLDLFAIKPAFDLNIMKPGTGHRRESFGNGFERICQALADTAQAFPDVDIVYPVQLDPNVREPVNRLLGGIDNVYLIEPLDYLPFVYLMNRSHIILTDSGGIQEEAPSLGKPVLVMRDTTERPEAVAAGTVRLIGTEVAAITQHLHELLTDLAAYERMRFAHNPYGDGQACQRIVQALAQLPRTHQPAVMAVTWPSHNALVALGLMVCSLLYSTVYTRLKQFHGFFQLVTLSTETLTA